MMAYTDTPTRTTCTHPPAALAHTHLHRHLAVPQLRHHLLPVHQQLGRGRAAQVKHLQAATALSAHMENQSPARCV